MSEDSRESNAKGFAFNGDMDAWIAAIRGSGAGQPGDVFLLFSERRATQGILANWAVATGMLVDANDEPAYTSFCFILAPSYKKFAIPLSEELSKAGITAVSIVALATAQSEQLCTTILEQAARTAVFLLGLELFRAEVMDSTTDHAVTSWTGFSHRMRSVEERHRPHLREVVRSLLAAAHERALFVTGICKLPSSAAGGLVDDLGSPEPLLIMESEPDTEQRMTEALVEIAERVRSNVTPLEVALQEVDVLIPQVDRRALGRSQLFFGCGHFEAAWQAVEPHLESFQKEYPGIYLNLGHSALAALRREEATKLLDAAVEAGISTFEELHTAYLLAYELKQVSTSDILLRQMKEHYPKEEATLELEYEKALRERRYIEAEDIARKLHLDFEAEMWSAFAKPVLELDALEELAEGLGKRDQFAAAAALECAHRGDFEMASIWARLVCAGSKYESKAVLIRIRAFGSGLLGTHKLDDDDVDELMPLLEYVALHPSEQSVRFALDRIFEETLDELDGLVLLGAALTRLIPSSVPFGLPVVLTDSPAALEIDAALDFVRRAFPIIGTPILALGFGTLPEELRSDVTPRLINALLFAIQESRFSDEYPQHGHLLLRTMELVCLEGGEPSRDLVAAQLIIQRLAASAGMQAARNLAEETLRALPERQPEFRRWRLGLAWVAYSESFARTGNAMAAMRHLCLAMAALKDDIVDLEVFCTLLRICTRVQRDVGLIPLALETIKAERKLRTAIGATGMLWQLGQVELTLRIHEADSKRDFMVLLLESMRQLRALPDSVEKLPLAALAASLVRANRNNGVIVPEPLCEELTASFQGESGYYPDLLRHLITGHIRREELIRLIATAGKAIRLDDMAAQFQPLQLVGEDAVEIACDTDDADLFTIAAALQCQPVLALRAIDRETSGTPTEKFRRWALEELARGRSIEQLNDLNATMRRIGEPESYSLVRSCETTITELGAVLAAGEAALLAADGSSGALCICIVFPDGTRRLQRLVPNAWSQARYAEWRQAFRNGYGRKSAPSESGWRSDDLRSSLKGISFGLSQVPAQLVILPCAALFGFPFAFTDAAGEFLGRRTRIAIAPSASWLVSTRQSKRHLPRKAVAWLGSPRSQDKVIRDAHTYVAPQLLSRDVEVIGSDYPEGLAGSGLAILLTHGIKGDFDRFRSVTDGREYYAPAEIAEKFTGCDCVVLLVCYGAHAVVPARTSETRGLLAALFAVGVRCVIASAWPVTLETIQYWLPTFLDGLAKGLPIAEAASAASRDVEVHVADAAAWGSLQVFGDATVFIGP